MFRRQKQANLMVPSESGFRWHLEIRQPSNLIKERRAAGGEGIHQHGSVEGLIDGIKRFESLSFDHQTIRDNALRFAPDRIASAFADLLMNVPRRVARSGSNGT